MHRDSTYLGPEILQPLSIAAGKVSVRFPLVIAIEYGILKLDNFCLHCLGTICCVVFKTGASSLGCFPLYKEFWLLLFT